MTIVSYANSTTGTEVAYTAIVKVFVAVAPSRFEAVRVTVIPGLDW